VVAGVWCGIRRSVDDYPGPETEEVLEPRVCLAYLVM
jgi:hypothetical protein